MMRQADMAAILEGIRHPPHRDGIAVIGETGHQRADHPLGMVRDIFPVQEALALLALLRIGAALAEREQAGEPAPRRPVFGPDQNRRPVDQIEPAAGDQADRKTLFGDLLRGDQCTDDAADRITVGNAECGQALERRGGEQFIRRGGSAQKAEMGGDLEFRIGHWRGEPK